MPGGDQPLDAAGSSKREGPASASAAKRPKRSSRGPDEADGGDGDDPFPIPLVDLDDLTEEEAGAAIVAALSRSGFLLVRSGKLLPAAVQARALEAAAGALVAAAAAPPGSPSPTSLVEAVVSHPSDPKQYIMLEGLGSLEGLPEEGEGAAAIADALRSYWRGARALKAALLHRLALGLGLGRGFFASAHGQNREALRLLRYPAVVPEAARAAAGNRCREHSDYGSLTILLQDDAGGLEAWNEAAGAWSPVGVAGDGAPPGALVVNVGSLLEKWTGGRLRATKHRVAGPASELSGTGQARLMAAAARDRFSAAFFADPDDDIRLEDICGGPPADAEAAAAAGVPAGDVAAYIRWRCGQGGVGVDYDPAEKLPPKATD